MNTIEMNAIRKDKDFCNERINEKSPVVEVFSRMAKGKDLQGIERCIILKK